MTPQLFAIRACTINFSSSSSSSYSQHEVCVSEVYSFDKQLIIYFGVNINHFCESVFQNTTGITISIKYMNIISQQI